MKRKLNVSAALATTAAVALLAGAANAQMSGAPQVCTTTQVSPAHNDCVMPTASAPGGGSFPGSFLVPGTNTSFAVHGFIQFDVTHDMGQHSGDTGFNQYTIPLDAGGGNAAAATHAANGGTTMGMKGTRPNIETRTPTAYGEVKTYIEFDFNQTGATQIGGNNDLLRLRQAYGTLGPWLMGQTLSLFTDAQAYADTAQGNQDAGMMDTLDVRVPQVRYTWLAGNGVSVAGSFQEEMGTNAGMGAGTQQIFADGTNGVALSTTAGNLTGTGVYYNWPKFVGAAEWDQPWGHVKLAAAGGVDDTDTARTGVLAAQQRHQFGVGAVTLTGHLNTWGKDALRGGLVYDHGAQDFLPGMVNGGRIYNDTTGSFATVNAWAAYASYEHFFNGQWRANEAIGYDRESGNPGFTSAVTLASIDKSHMTNEVNVIYSPVPQTDFILEWQYANRQVRSGQEGTLNRLDAQFKFYF